MFKSEIIINQFIQWFIPKQIIYEKADKKEKTYWDKFWSDEIAYYQKYGESRETRDEWLNRCNMKILKHYEELLCDFTGKTLIECGSGSGILSLLMSKAGAITTIVDFSSKSLQYARLIAHQLQIKKGVKYLKANIFQLKSEKEKYDVAWNCGVIEHYKWHDAIRLIKSMSQLVHKDGHVIITLPNLLSFEIIYRMLKEGKGSEIYYSKQQLQSMMEEAGLYNVQVESLVFTTPSFAPKLNKFLEHKSIIKFLPPLSWLFSGVGTKKN